MARSASSVLTILSALPAVQEAVRIEIASRMAAGEFISGVDGDRIISSHPVDIDLAARREEILERCAINAMADKTEQKSVA